MHPVNKIKRRMINMPAEVITDYRLELEKVISHMFKKGSDLFFAYVIAKMERHIVTPEEEKNFPPDVAEWFIAGIDFSCNDNFVLMIHPRFFKMNINQRVAVLKHEIFHIVSLHTLRVTIDEYAQNKMLYNTCMDLEVNQLLDNLPSTAVTIDSINKAFKTKLEYKKKFEEYYYQLKKNSPKKKVMIGMNCPTCGGTGKDPNDQDGKGKGQDKKQGNSGGGDGEENNQGKPCPTCGGGSALKGFDIHPYLEKLSENKKNGNSQFNKMIDKARELASQAKEDTIRSRGLIGSDLEEYLEKLFDVDPFIKLRNFIGRIPSVNKEITYYRIDRRTRLMPSYKRQFKEKILVGIDTSGSIGNKEIILFLSHIEKIIRQYNNSAELSIAFCDAEIQTIIENYKGAKKDILNKKLKLGRGGTSFLPVLDLPLKDKKFREVTKLLYFTDGYGEDKIKKVYNQYIMWIYTPSSHREVEMQKGNRYEHIKLPQSFFEKEDR
jgi:predicted metal-dependent peptidase